MNFSSFRFYEQPFGMRRAQRIFMSGLLLTFFGVSVQAQSANCDNPFFPVREGSSWTYTHLNRVIPLVETRTVTEVGLNSFSLAREERTPTKSRRRSEYWHCNALGLLERLDSNSVRAIVSSYVAVGGARVEQFMSGIDLPDAPLRVGLRWESDKQLEYGPATEAGTRHTLYSQYEVTAREQVTVPAGTFEAFRVDYRRNWYHTSRLGGSREDSYTTDGHVEGSSWYAEGVGLIKEVRRRTDTNALQTTFAVELTGFSKEETSD